MHNARERQRGAHPGQSRHHGTKKQAVTAALVEYIRRRKQRRILDLFDTIDDRKDDDYKAGRRRD